MERTQLGYAFAPSDKSYAVVIIEETTYTLDQSMGRLTLGVDLGSGNFIQAASEFKTISGGAVHADAVLVTGYITQTKVGISLWNSGSGRLFVGLSIPTAEDHYATAYDGMLDMVKSVRDITEPGHVSGQNTLLTPWYMRLTGSRIRHIESHSSGSSGGSYSDTKIDLCSDGSYTKYRESSVSIDVPGASGGSSGQSSDRGRWELREVGRKPVLFLHSTSGKSKKYELTLGDETTAVYLDGERYWVNKTSGKDGPGCR